MSTPAETYEAFMVPTLFRPWAARLIATANPQPGERVLDLACGTGIVARCVSPIVGPAGTVSGLDFSADMLAVAREAATREEVSIEWKLGRAEKLPYDQDNFDDHRTALTEIHRVLASRGRVALSVFQDIELHPFYQALDEAIRRRLGASGVQDIFALGNAGSLRSMLEEAGFHDVEIDSQSQTARFANPEGFLAGEIDVDTASIPAMQSLDTRAREELTRALQQEMEEPLRDVTRDGRVEIPFHVHIAKARKSV
jgi:ubiquinone/menaquinone biosynthesis C-methylase UbiE